MSKQVGIGVDIVDRKVFIGFDRKTDHLSLNIEQAYSLLDAIYERIRKLDKNAGKNSSIIALPGSFH